jgi:hypothetical protein
MPALNPGKKHTNWRPQWCAELTKDAALLIPFSTTHTYREEWQKKYSKTKKNGLIKATYLCLDSGTWYPLDKWNQLPIKWYTLGTLEAESAEMWDELYKWSSLYPNWKCRNYIKK